MNNSHPNVGFLFGRTFKRKFIENETENGKLWKKAGAAAELVVNLILYTKHPARSTSITQPAHEIINSF